MTGIPGAREQRLAKKSIQCLTLYYLNINQPVFMIKKIAGALMPVLFSMNLFAQVNHVEPLNWWIGMKNPNLQLLIEGNNVGETTPEFSYAGVSIKKITRADSKNYLFIDLVIGKN